MKKKLKKNDTGQLPKLLKSTKMDNSFKAVADLFSCYIIAMIDENGNPCLKEIFR